MQCTGSLQAKVTEDAEQDNLEDKASATPVQTKTQEQDVQRSPRRSKRRAGSSDFIASAVTRRFGYSKSWVLPLVAMYLLLILCGL